MNTSVTVNIKNIKKTQIRVRKIKKRLKLKQTNEQDCDGWILMRRRRLEYIVVG